VEYNGFTSSYSERIKELSFSLEFSYFRDGVEKANLKAPFTPSLMGAKISYPIPKGSSNNMVLYPLRKKYSNRNKLFIFST